MKREPSPTRREDVEALVVSYVRDDLGEPGVESLAPDDNLLTSGLVDSVGIQRLIGHLERCLGVRVPPDALVPENFRTIRRIGEFLLDLRG